MHFTLVGRLVAWIVLVFSVARLALAVVLAASNPPGLDMQRYLGTQTTGEAIDQSLIAIVVAIALGILTDISRSAANRNT